MDYERASKKEQFRTALVGITADCDMVNGVVHAITLRDASGGLLRVERSNDYEALKAFVLAKPKLVKRYQLAGTWKGLKVEERFAYEPEATSRREELEGWPDTYELTIAEVEVPEES